MAVIRLQGQEKVYGACIYEYDERDKIGQGGMGEVFLGFRTDGNGARSRVAVKHLTNTTPEVVERARCEASIHLRHENLVYMYGFVEKRSGGVMGSVDYYVVSEFVEGISLDAFINGNLVGRGGTISTTIQGIFNKYVDNREKIATEIVKAVLSGIMALHDAGYIHRDIDPTNIMVTTGGLYKLIDYGVARKVSNLKADDGKAQGVFVGKADYAAPELIRGEVTRQDFSTDIYSIGILYYQLVTGSLPFQGDRLEVIKQQLTKSLPLHNLSSPAIRNVIAKATEKKQSKRYTSAASFRTDIDRVEAGEIPDRPLNKKKIVFIAVAAMVIISLIFVGVLSIDNKPDGKKEPAQDFIAIKKTTPVTEPDPDKQAYTYYMGLLDNEKKDSVIKGFIGMKQLATQGYPDAVYEVAYIYAFNNKAKHQKQALGIKLDVNGRPVSKDVRDAGEKWLKTAIDDKNPKAYRCMYWLAAYQTDKEKAIQMLQKAFDGAIEAGDGEYSAKIENNLNALKKR